MDDIQKTINVLKTGGICIFPTDTAFGIGCRMDNVQAVEKVFKLRNRPEEKAVLVLASDVEMAKEYGRISDEVQEELVDRYWPGPLTIVLPCYTKKVPSIVRANGKTLAIRMPDHTQLQYIIQQVGVPIIAPSANFSGESTPLEFNQIDKKILSLVDFSLQGMCTMRGVSTIIDTTANPWKVLRK